MLLEEIRAALQPVFASRPEILEAYLFGSTARGTDTPRSDVDLAFYVGPLREEAYPYGYLADLVGCCISQLKRNDVDGVILNTAPPLLYHRVLRDGIRLFSQDLTATTTREGRALSRYFDYLPQFKKMDDLQRQQIQHGEFGR